MEGLEDRETGTLDVGLNARSCYLSVWHIADGEVLGQTSDLRGDFQDLRGQRHR